MAEDKKSILVVEDEPDTLEFLRLILKKEGYVVRTAMDGREALQQIQARPDLVLLDAKLPRMS